MHRLTIHNFGPIRDATIELAPFLVLIGPQASGKSTISKLVYYFLQVRDEVTAFVAEAADQKYPRGDSWALKKRLRNRFVEFWGPIPQPPDVCITYEYRPGYDLTITLDQEQHKYVTPRFSSPAWSDISRALRETREEFKTQSTPPEFISGVRRLASEHRQATLLRSAREKCNAIFSYDKELLFIPAGRSLLSTLADQIQYIHPHMLDYPMRQFVEFVNASRAFFDRSLDDIIRERQALSSTPVWFSAVRRAQSLVRKILQGEYRYDREGGKLFITPEVFTKINYASSGQQEAVWILLSLFLLVLEQTKTGVFIEEPEAHLFPSAQNDVIRFATFVHNAIGCDFVVTTHSPYLLSCVNNLLYAGELAGTVPAEQVVEVVPQYLWLSRQNVAGYFVGNGGTAALFSSEAPILRTELLDTASEEVNEEYLRLLSLEQGGE